MELLLTIFDQQTIEIITRLLVAMLLGMILGTERVFAHTFAGMRTYAFVSLGAALFVVVSWVMTEQYVGLTNFDPLRMASQVVVGIGFLGAGMIIFRDARLEGLTTAASLGRGGIGVAAGFGLFTLAAVATIFMLFVFIGMWAIEKDKTNRRHLGQWRALRLRMKKKQCGRSATKSLSFGTRRSIQSG